MTRDWLLSVAIAAMAHGAVSILPVDLSSGQASRQSENSITFRLTQASAPEAAEPAPVLPTETAVKPKVEPPQPESVAPAEPVVEKVADVASLAPSKVKTVASETTAERIDLRPYGRHVYMAVNRIKKYPVVARQMRMEGQALVQLVVDGQGQIVGVPRIYRSSGHQLLDDEALRMVMEAGPYPPLPDGFQRESATIVVPIDFSLKT